MSYNLFGHCIEYISQCLISLFLCPTICPALHQKCLFMPATYHGLFHTLCFTSGEISMSQQYEVVKKCSFLTGFKGTGTKKGDGGLDQIPIFVVCEIGI